MKLWNFSNFVFKKDHSMDKIKEEWFIIAHKGMINSIALCEKFDTDKFIISASNDHNIHLHRLSNGVYIG